MGSDIRPEMNKIKCPTLVLGSWMAYKGYGATHDSAQRSTQANSGVIRMFLWS